MGEPNVVCPQCGTAARARVRHRGSTLVLVVLLFFLIVPGVVYLAYMLTGSYQTCRGCGARGVVRQDSPVGRELLARYHPAGVPS